MQAISRTGESYRPRREIVYADMAQPSVPKVAHRIQVGDFVSTGGDEYFAQSIEFMENLGDAEWHAIVGNHDYETRTPEQAAALMLQPGINFTVDLDYCVLVCMFIRSWGNSSTASQAPATAWLEEQLVLHAGRPVIVAGHPPFRDTVFGQGAPPMQRIDEAALKAVFNRNTNVKAYVCGHSHSQLYHPVVTNIECGTRRIVQVNASSYAHVTPGDENDRWDNLVSPFITVEPDRLEIRFRDHGTGQWSDSSLVRHRTHVIPF